MALKRTQFKTKAKPCKKGTGKAFGFIGCGDITEHLKYGLCKKKCYPTWLTKTEAGALEIKKATFQVQKPRIELETAFEEKKARETLANLMVNVRNTCHEFIRLRDKGKPCISCGQQWKPDFQACHFYKAELFSNLKFNEDNIHGGCIGCNIHSDGNESGYRVGLKNRFGTQYLAELDLKAGESKRNDFKWDRETLVEIRNYYRAKIKSLPK